MPKVSAIDCTHAIFRARPISFFQNTAPPFSFMDVSGIDIPDVVSPPHPRQTSSDGTQNFRRILPATRRSWLYWRRQAGVSSLSGSASSGETRRSDFSDWRRKLPSRTVRLDPCPQTIGCREPGNSARAATNGRPCSMPAADPTASRDKSGAVAPSNSAPY